MCWFFVIEYNQDVTFIQKLHWEFVQGEFNPLKLSPHIYLDIVVGCHSSWFFKSYSMHSLKIWHNFKKLSPNVRKKKAGPQNRWFLWIRSRVTSESFKCPTLDRISTINNTYLLIEIKNVPRKCNIREKFLCLVSLLFVAIYLAEHTWMDSTQSTTITNLILASELGNGLKHVEVRSVFLQRRKCEEA